MIKTLRKLGIERSHFNVTENMNDKPLPIIMLNEEKVKAFPLKSGMRKDC
jgi:hypothetical protein